MFDFQIGAFCNLPLILHKAEQKNSANYLLPIFHIPHFTIALRNNPHAAYTHNTKTLLDVFFILV